jgi:hypothetical protein
VSVGRIGALEVSGEQHGAGGPGYIATPTKPDADAAAWADVPEQLGWRCSAQARYRWFLVLREDSRLMVQGTRLNTIAIVRIEWLLRRRLSRAQNRRAFLLFLPRNAEKITVLCEGLKDHPIISHTSAGTGSIL